MTHHAAEVKHVHVLGAGRMGQGIALAFAFAGLRVTLIDFKEREARARDAFASAALGEIGRQLQTQVDFGRIDAQQAADALARVEVLDRTGCEAVLGDCEVVFEAVPELMAAKEAAFAWLCARVSSTATIASTTSTFLVTDLQKVVTHPQRLINAHWLNPAHLIPLVEISRSSITDDSVIARLKDLLRRVGKVPVECAPSAGYIVPRIQALVMNEAARMVEEGVASAHDIDMAVRASACASRSSGCSNSSTGAAATFCITRRTISRRKSARASSRPPSSRGIWMKGATAFATAGASTTTRTWRCPRM